MAWTVLSDELLRLQPVLVTTDGVFITGRAGRIAATEVVLWTRTGSPRPMKRVATLASLERQARRRDENTIRAQVEREAARLRSAGSQPAIAWFLKELAPRMQGLDSSIGATMGVGPAMTGARGARPEPKGTDALIASLPKPAFPAFPSLVVGARAWRLTPVRSANDRLRIQYGRQVLACSGEYSAVATLQRGGEMTLQRSVLSAASMLAMQHGGPDIDAEGAAATLELGQQGWIIRGDLILVGGTPPLLAHIVPPHHNSTLSRFIHRDLAMAMPLFTVPPTVDRSLLVLEQVGGRWVQAHLPNGLCLGSVPGDFSEIHPTARAAGFLRWAAIRIAQNGRFHSSDGDTVNSE